MKINTALILCTGYGRKLKPITLDIPKQLMEIIEVTLLENNLYLIQEISVEKTF